MGLHSLHHQMIGARRGTHRCLNVMWVLYVTAKPDSVHSEKNAAAAGFVYIQRSCMNSTILCTFGKLDIQW